jgi:hypothetical protein
MSEREISVHLVDGRVTWDGETAPITNYFVSADAGEELDLTRVTAVVAGPYSSGEWLSTLVSDDERAVVAWVN